MASDRGVCGRRDGPAPCPPFPDDPRGRIAGPEPLRLDRAEPLAPDAEPVSPRGHHRSVEASDWLWLIQQGGQAPVTPETSPLVEARAATEVGFADLVERWVKRVALGGDGRRGAARLDIGSGRLSGAEVVVVAEAGHVSVELSLPAGEVDGGLSERLRDRLQRRGYSADVSVR